MKPAVGILAALLMGVAAAPEAAACTFVALLPKDQRELDLRDQRQLRARADAVFLARTRPVLARSGTLLSSLVLIDGEKRPRDVFLPYDTSDCMPALPPRGVRVVFARQIRPADAPWKFWTWGRWVVTAHMRPSGVVDPDLAAAMRRAANRARQAG